MAKPSAIIILSLLVASGAKSTSMTPLSTEQKVSRAAFIAIGTVETVKSEAKRNQDQVGTPVRAVIKITGFIKAPTNGFPSRIEVVYGPPLYLGATNEKQRLAGKTLIFFLTSGSETN